MFDLKLPMKTCSLSLSSAFEDHFSPPYDDRSCQVYMYCTREVLMQDAFDLYGACPVKNP